MRSKPSEERLPFFVYGTLLPGQPNAAVWEEAIVVQETAVLPGGHLYDMGSFPMLVVVEEETAVVVGKLIQVAATAYETVLARLDALEGYDPQTPAAAGYRRVARQVLVKNDDAERGQNGRFAWVYVGQETAVRDLMPLPEGDWVAYSAKTAQAMAQWWREINGRYHQGET